MKGRMKRKREEKNGRQEGEHPTVALSKMLDKSTVYAKIGANKQRKTSFLLLSEPLMFSSATYLLWKSREDCQNLLWLLCLLSLYSVLKTHEHFL